MRRYLLFILYISFNMIIASEYSKKITFSEVNIYSELSDKIKNIYNFKVVVTNKNLNSQYKYYVSYDELNRLRLIEKRDNFNYLYESYKFDINETLIENIIWSEGKTNKLNLYNGMGQPLLVKHFFADKEYVEYFHYDKNNYLYNINQKINNKNFQNIFYIYNQNQLLQIEKYDKDNNLILRHNFNTKLIEFEINNSNVFVNEITEKIHDNKNRLVTDKISYYYQNNLILEKVKNNYNEYNFYENNLIQKSIIKDINNITAFRLQDNIYIDYHTTAVMSIKKYFIAENQNYKTVLRYYKENNTLTEEIIIEKPEYETYRSKNDANILKIKKNIIGKFIIIFYLKNGLLTEKIYMDNNNNILGTYKYSYNNEKNQITESFLNNKNQFIKKIEYYFKTPINEHEYEYLALIQNYGFDSIYRTSQSIEDNLNYFKKLKLNKIVYYNKNRAVLNYKEFMYYPDNQYIIKSYNRDKDQLNNKSFLQKETILKYDSLNILQSKTIHIYNSDTDELINTIKVSDSGIKIKIKTTENEKIIRDYIDSLY